MTDPTGAAPPRRRGRRPAGQDSRADIVAAAHRLFAVQGYDSVSLRAVAREAGVDPAMVHHWFSGKRDLFIHSIGALDAGLADRIAELDELPRSQAGEGILRLFLTTWDPPQMRLTFAATIRAAVSADDAVQPVREFLTSEIIRRFPASSPLGAELVATQVVGIGVARYVVRLGTVAEASIEELVAQVGPNLQRYLDLPPLPDEPTRG